MKTLKTLLFAVTLLVGFSSMALAQNADATITANANVIADIAATNVSDIDFGDVVVNTEKFLDASDQSVSTTNGVTGGEAFGAVDIDFAANENIDIDVQFPSSLAGQTNASNTLSVDFSADGDGGTGANAVIVNGSISYDGAVSDGLFANALTNGAKADWGSPSGTTYTISDFTMPSSGELTVIIGGEVSAASGQSTEVYQGDITVTATVAN